MSKRRRRRESDAPRRNPELDTTDFTEKVLPGVAAYVGTRFLARAGYSMAQKKQSKYSRHIAAGLGVAVAGAAWAFGDRLKQTRQYYDPILIGAGTAAAVAILQTYMPKYGWMVGDLPAGAPAAQAAPASPSVSDLLNDDDYEAVPLLLPGQPPPPGTVTQSMKNAASEEELISELSDYNEMNDTSFS